MIPTKPSLLAMYTLKLKLKVVRCQISSGWPAAANVYTIRQLRLAAAASGGGLCLLFLARRPWLQPRLALPSVCCASSCAAISASTLLQHG